MGVGVGGTSVGVAVGFGVFVGVGAAVGLGVFVGVAVGFGVGVAVGAFVGALVCVDVGSGVTVAVGFRVTVAVGSGVGLSVGSGVAEGSEVGVGVISSGVAVPVSTGVPLGDGVAVATGVFVTTSVGETPSVAAVVGVSDDDWFLSLRLDIITSKTIPAMTSIADPRMIRIRLFIYTILPETQSIISVLSLKKPLGSFYKDSVSIAIIELDFLSAMRMMGHP